MKPIITVEDIAKRYYLGAHSTSYATVRETLAGAMRAPFRRFRRNGHAVDEPLWALRDINFEVHPGEVVGIIGRNGAGKSTLLKILSRITDPTAGRVKLYGRVGSLLEVGTGFHAELTGRENIYLNGAILGMKKAEIKGKFDEIVAFAEIEQFIDTPVKRYSSGMYVRLAFAVAAHLEPEILIIDEVLAVGDMSFQKKCLGKMGDIGKEGRTVLFVSHNASAVIQLCSDCIWLDQGKIVGRGEPGKIVLDYLASGQPESVDGLITAEMHEHDPLGLCFNRISILDENGSPTSRNLFGKPLNFQVEFEVKQATRSARLGLVIHKLDESVLCALHNTDDISQDFLNLPHGKYVTNITVDASLMPGSYSVALFAKPDTGFWNSGHQSLDYVKRAIVFHVEEVSAEGLPVLPTGGMILPPSQWSVQSQ